MSTASRLISGSAASWARIGVTLLTQLVLVPVYLTYWDVETYGVWIAVLTLVSTLSMFDFGHQTYLEFEFLRIGKDDLLTLRKYLWSGVSVGLAISLLQIVAIVLIMTTGILPFLLDSNSPNSVLVRAAGWVLLAQGISWLLSKSVSGLLIRALAPFGYYPRMAWWNVFKESLSAVIPILAVVLGADLLTTGIVSAFTIVVCSVPQYVDAFRLLYRIGLEPTSPSIYLGFTNFLHSLALSARKLLEDMRHSSIRLVLIPLVGATGLATFATMRTGANVALQGLNTVTNPLMPELMRFLNQRDQARSEAAFGTVWFVVIALMAPAVVVLQVFVEPLYTLWTRGQMSFDPLLFAILSLNVLVYAAAQPAIAVVKGNNLLMPQLMLSILSAGLVIGLTLFLVPIYGLVGIGVALLTAEIVATVGYKMVAQRWLHRQGLSWPGNHYAIAMVSVLVAALAMTGLVWFPEIRWAILPTALGFFLLNLWKYWQVLPVIATQRTKKMVGAIPGIKKLFA